MIHFTPIHHAITPSCWYTKHLVQGQAWFVVSWMLTPPLPLPCPPCPSGDKDLALKVYHACNASGKVIALLAEKGDMAALAAYTGSSGQKMDYMYLLQVRGLPCRSITVSISILGYRPGILPCLQLCHHACCPCPSKRVHRVCIMSRAATGCC